MKQWHNDREVIDLKLGYQVRTHIAWPHMQPTSKASQ
jgi:hypothetical protein